MHEDDRLDERWTTDPRLAGPRLPERFNELVEFVLEQWLRMVERRAARSSRGDQIACTSADPTLVSLELDQEAAGRTGDEEVDLMVAAVGTREGESREGAPWLVLGKPLPNPGERFTLVGVRRLALFAPVLRHGRSRTLRDIPSLRVRGETAGAATPRRASDPSARAPDCPSRAARVDAEGNERRDEADARNRNARTSRDRLHASPADTDTSAPLPAECGHGAFRAPVPASYRRSIPSPLPIERHV